MSKKKLLISFSGGRTSAYMTKRLLEELDPRVYEIIVVFANVGKECEETLEFVHECDTRWGFGTVWVECITNQEHGKGVQARVVYYYTADRTGSVFEDSIRKHGMPNVSQPLCTRELKTYTINAYMRSIGWSKYHRALGIRVDEIDRVNPNHKKERIVYPCVSMFPTTKQDINKFWMQQEFDLRLKSYEGNCDCCYKKSLRKLLTIAKNTPEKFEWWKSMEELYENYSPASRKNNSKVKYPIRFFRGNLSVDDILLMSKEPFEEARDESYDIQQYVQGNLFGNELDTPNGCTESCEAF